MISSQSHIDYTPIEALLRGLKPDPILTVTEWADTKRQLPPTSAAPGQFNSKKTPYTREISDKLSATNPAQIIFWKKCSQIAGTETGNNWVGYTIDVAPAGMLYVMPTDTMMKNCSTTRIQPMINSTPALSKKIKPARTKDGGNTMMLKAFEGGLLFMVGANSPNGVSSNPVQKVYLDEIDRYPANIAGEGDVIALAITRTTTYGDLRKIFGTSTPTIAGTSLIDKEFKRTGQRHYHVPCPECGTYQKLVFTNLKWETGKYDDVKYECAHCHELIHERHKTKMLEAGHWVPDFPEKEDGITFGYASNALYSPIGWYKWATMAKEYDDALNDLPKMITFTNTKLGEVYETKGDAPDWQEIYNKRENHILNTPSEDVIFITAGVDIQPDRIEVEIVGWGKGKQSWSIDYRVLLGSTSTASNEVWGELSKIISETWTRTDGAVLPLHLMCVDSGNNTTVVYEFCRKYPVSKVLPIKGRDNMAVMISQPKAVDTSRSGKKIEGVKVWMVGVSLIKTELYGWLKLQHIDGQDYPDGYCHFPMYDETHFKSLTAEQVEYTVNKKGFSVLTWVKKYERNERLDCRVYARAAAAQIGIDRLKDKDWDRLISECKDLVPANKPTVVNKKKNPDNDFWRRH